MQRNFSSHFSALVISICCLLTSTGLFSQYTIKGIVVDQSNKEPLIGASVNIAQHGTISSLNGRFTLSVSSGQQKLELNYIGYIPLDLDLDLVSDTTLYFELIPSNLILQTATVTSGRFEKALGETTVSLEVLPSELINNINGNQVDEVLDKVPGLSMVDGQANIRGGSGFSYGAGSRVLLLVDDIPALQADAGYPNWNDLAVETIGQIEVVKGAASALYGSAAMNGIINIRTDYPKSTPETTASLFYTTYLKPKDDSQAWWDESPFVLGGSLVHKHKWKKLDLIASGFYYKQESFNQSTFDNYGRGSVHLRYRVTDRLAIGVKAVINSGDSGSFFYWKNDSTGLFQASESTIMTSQKTRFFVDPSISYLDKFNNRHKLLGRLFHVDNNVSDNRSNKSDLLYGEYQFQRHFAFNLDLTAGFVASGTSIEAQLYGDSAHTSRNLAGYLQLEQKLWNRLNLALGLRYERNSLKGPSSIAGMPIEDPNGSESKPVFRVGANYQLAKYTYLRSSYGQGYRYPTIAEKYITTTFGATYVIPNPALKSETGWTAELGLKQGFGLSTWQGFLDVAGFWMEYQDMMEFIFTGTKGFQAQNIGNTRIKGIDVSVTGRGKILRLPLSILLGYTHIDPTFQDFTMEDSLRGSCGCNVLKYRSKNSFKVDLESTFDRFSAGAALNYSSNLVSIDRIFEFFIPGVAAYRKRYPNGYMTVDLRIAYKPLKSLKLSLIGKNIFNQLVSLRPGIMEAPANISLRLDYTI
ncbi:MAG: TonB-dependent receptor [Saprospiraceae bacterium]